MITCDLSVIIPARHEMFLSRTVDELIKNKRGKTEVIVGLDGEWADPPIKDHPDVTILYFGESIGQRAITNRCVSLSKAKYIMKVDAHCAFDEGFDVKMMNEMKDNYTMIPAMYNLHGFDWVCPDGHRRYQGPSGPCKECGKPTTRDIKWAPRLSRRSEYYRFDNTLHFQYWSAMKKETPKDAVLVETMSAQGSCFMLTREKYWELDICDEKHGSWGQQGTEVACKTWLSGGKLLTNRNTWYSHMFRTQGGDFGFPYPISGRQVEGARKYSRDLFLNNKWPKAKHTFGWLIKKFDAPEWPTKAILYYTDNQLDEKVMEACQRQLLKANLPIYSVSLKPIDFGTNTVLNLERGYLTLFKQILAGLKACKEDIVFTCDHDVLYHPSHFDFMPPEKKVFYYNFNVWKVRLEDGLAIHYDIHQSNQLCGYRDLLIEDYTKRVEWVEKNGWSTKLGFEPGTQRKENRINDYKNKVWWSEYPSLDIKHGKNLTPVKWYPKDFRQGERACPNWMTSDEISGWGVVKNKMSELLASI